MKNETAMTQAEVVTNIYTVLEMLRAAGLNEIVDYWCNLLYTEDGDCWLPAWTEAKLRVMENDVIHYA